MNLGSERTVEYFTEIGKGHLPGYLGMTVTEVGEGVLRIEMPVRQELLAPNGFLHAGSAVSLADTAAGYACVAHLPPGATSFTTLELKTNFLGTVREGMLRGEARAVHLGRTTQIWDATVYSEQSDRPIAMFRCTQLILYPKA